MAARRVWVKQETHRSSNIGDGMGEVTTTSAPQEEQVRGHERLLAERTLQVGASEADFGAITAT